MKSRICLTLIALLLCNTSALAVQWAWDDGGVEYDDSMTVDGQSFTTDPTNPTLSAYTSSQPPIVVVQSTTGDSFDCASMPVCSTSNRNTEPVCRVPGGALCTHRTDLGTMTHSDYGGRQECNNLGPGWRLPTKDELSIMYNNKVAIGGFGMGYYWSGTEGYYSSTTSTISVWAQRFSTGNQALDKKSNTYGVRCVRRF